MLHTTVQPCERVDHRKDGKSPTLLSGHQRFLCQRTGDAPAGQQFSHFFRIFAERRLHRLADHAGESVAAFITLSNQSLDNPANLGERVVDVGRMFTAELHDLDRIPHDMIRADTLVPERLNSYRTSADLRVPQEKT